MCVGGNPHRLPLHSGPELRHLRARRYITAGAFSSTLVRLSICCARGAPYKAAGAGIRTLRGRPLPAQYARDHPGNDAPARADRPDRVIE